MPNEKSRIFGGHVVSDLQRRWNPNPMFCHFGKRGGHLAALRPHARNSYRASIDLRSFFSNVTRSKVTRSLQSVGKTNKESYSIAEFSCVHHLGRKFLPFGFVQSMALATLALENSALGSTLRSIRASGVYVSVYVDDILLSHNCFATLEEVYARVVDAAIKSNFEVAADKCESPSPTLQSFNIKLDGVEMSVSAERLVQFEEAYRIGSEKTRKAILDYVTVVNTRQALGFASL